MITKQEIDNMSPEELEAFKRQASLGIFKNIAKLVLIKVGISIILRRLAKKLSD